MLGKRLGQVAGSIVTEWHFCTGGQGRTREGGTEGGVRRLGRVVLAEGTSGGLQRWGSDRQ